MSGPDNYDGEMLHQRMEIRHQELHEGGEEQQQQFNQPDFMRLDMENLQFQNASVQRTSEQIVRLKVLTSRLKPLVHHPEKSALTKEFGKTFKPRVSEKVRLEKQRNKRSRLYQKNNNLNLINDAENAVVTDSFDKLSEAVSKEQVLCDSENLCDLSAFMTEDKNSNVELTKLFLGSNDKQEGMDIQGAMDKMYEIIMSTNLGSIKLENDKEVARNAATLEKLSTQVMAFDRLNKQYGYLKNFDENDQEKMQEKLEQVRSVVNYYQLRKDVITDKMYSTHYNDEISMDITMAKTIEEQELAEKLLKAYTAGKYMMEKCGISPKKIKAIGEPKFTRVNEGKQLIKEFETPLKLGKSKDSLQERYNNIRQIKKADNLILKNEKMGQLLADKVVQNLKNQDEEYKEEAYDSNKVKGFIDELKTIDIKSLKCRTYRDMMINFNTNYKLCNRVEMLQRQIARGLMHGFEDGSVNDGILADIRAKINYFASFKRTLCAVNNQLVARKDNVGRNDDWWKKYLTKTLNSAGNTIFTPSEAEEVFNKYKSEAYQKDSLVKDFLNKDNIIQGNSLADAYTDHLIKEGRKEGRSIANADKNFYGLIQGKSPAEIERLFNLYNGSVGEQMEYYKEFVSSVTNFDIKSLNADNMGTFLDDYDKKMHFISICSDSLVDICNKIKDYMEFSDEKLTLPKGFDSVEDMILKARTLQEFAKEIRRRLEDQKGKNLRDFKLEAEQLYETKKQETVSVLGQENENNLKVLEEIERKRAKQEQESPDISNDANEIDELFMNETKDKDALQFEHEEGAGLDTEMIKALGIEKEIKMYSGPYFTAFNDYFRKNEKSLRGDIQISAVKLKKRLSKCKINRTVVVNRGVNNIQVLLNMFGIKRDPNSSNEESLKKALQFVKESENAGKEVILGDPGFVSTSYNAENGFTTSPSGIEFVIKVNKGTGGANISKLSKYNEEKEVILNAGTKFRLIKIYNGSKKAVDGLEYREPTYEKVKNDKNYKRETFLKIYLETIPQQEDGVKK